jgi:hypothetical protein
VSAKRQRRLALVVFASAVTVFGCRSNDVSSNRAGRLGSIDIAK